MTPANVVAEGEEPAVNGGPSVPAAPPGSLLADLRRRAAEQRKERTIDVPVGGDFGDHLLIRYKQLPIDELERYGELQGKITNVALAIDMMAACCIGVYGRNGDDAPPQRLADDQGPVGLDDRLAKLLGDTQEWELTPREAVYAVFGNKAFLLGEHATAVAQWMTASEEEPSLGEASAARE